MVLIPVRSHARAYARILSHSRTTSVLLLCSPDVDALCACRILTQLLRDDHVPHKVVPVGGWEELSRVAEEVEGDGSIGTLVLLNLGGLFDLSEFFSLPKSTTLHLIDSHRPTNLSNLFGSRVSAEEGEVWVWDDGEGDTDLEEEKRAFQRLEFEPESDGEDEDEDEDEDIILPNGRRRLRTGSSTDSEERKEEKEGVGNDDAYLRMGRMLKKRIQKYYSTGTYYGQSIACQLYTLTSSLGRSSPDLLWLAILGLTYQFTSSLIDRDRYDAYAEVFKTEVRRMSAGGGEEEEKNADRREITEEEELQFRLFRHWNLFDSMLHSSYVAGKLELWREKGRKRLQGLLAKMGFSLDQCQQTYSHMAPPLKNSLRASLLAIAPDYGLYQLTYPSFIRSYGYRSSLSASDAVEAVGAILEVASKVKIADGEFVGGGAGEGEWVGVEGMNGGVDGEERDGREEGEEGGGNGRKKKDREWWIYNFWRAHDALSPADTNLLRSALPLSMSIHRAIVRQGTSLIDKQSIKTLRTFRLVTIKEGPDMPIFSHPPTLLRLAIWLVDAVRDLVERGKKGAVKSLPFVVCCLDEPNDSWVVVGVTGAAEYGDVRKNKFGLAFKEAAHASGARVRNDRFEADVIEVRKDDLNPFIGKLQLSLNAKS
ncbi:CDC45-like protein [Atractiella rhizophila]|nr:CDC45-like protein [Atractiella rhizophila]